MAAANKDAVPMYPVPSDEGDGFGAYGDYPVTGDASDVYPVADATDDAGYPVVDAYPLEDTDHDAISYPVIDKYPDDAVDNHEARPYRPIREAPTTKRRYEADKEVVALLPTHLQAKRRRPANLVPAATVTSSASRTLSTAPNGRRSAPPDTKNDDLDRLFQELGD